jgi:2-polyprenyl-6-methoxyphenol hydroxylase-like FAD-dependent oxidoreductase
MTDNQQLDVLINGAGPAGTTLAIDLARRGVNVRIIDKAPHAFDGSRAKGIQPRTLELLEDLGALDDILAGGQLYPLLGLHVGPLTIPWRMFRNTDPDPDIPYPNTWLIAQFRTDRTLHARLNSLGRQVELNRELVEFTQDNDTVTAKIAGPDGDEEITTRYLVGADGGPSTVRRQLGLDFAGSTDEQDRIFIVDAAVTGLSRNRWHMWPRLGGKFIGACPLPHSDLFQVMIRLAPGEEPPADEAQINTRIQAHTRNQRITLRDIQWRSVFRPNIRLAERYRLGRVLIAGDAAHVHTPAGAQGLNTGIQDGYNLGWKLAQVLAGADDQLLDTYQDERLPIAAGVLGLSTRKYDAISKLDPSSIRRGTDEKQLELTYHGGPLAPTSSEHTTTLRIGDRAPDSPLHDTTGDPVRLFDTYRGPHFTAIAYGPSAAHALEDLRWPPTGAPLKRVAVQTLAANADYVLTDQKGTFRGIYGLTEDTLLLVRPDGYIGHIATRDMLITTHTAMRSMSPTTDIAEVQANSATAHPADVTE